MSLGFILGTATVDHQAAMVEQLARDMAQYPNDQFYYLVPNHIKFETEIDVLSRLGQSTHADAKMYAESKLQVLSFSRLAWFFLRNTAGYQVPRISGNGLNMLVFQILANHQADLRLFAGEVNQPGFIAELTRQLEELKMANISADDLARIAKQIDGQQGTLHSKLHDLVLIYQEYELAVAGRYLGNTEIYAQLADYIQHDDFSHVHFYLDRFSQFTASEQTIVSAIIQHSASVTVSLTLDQPATNGVDENSMFLDSGRLYYRLTRLAKTTGVAVLPDQFANVPRGTRDMAAVDRLLIADAKMAAIEPQALQTKAAVQVFTTDSRLTELQQVARIIRQKVATGQYRYRDFLVLTKHIDSYTSALTPTFDQFDIPFFNDHEKSMDDHPLVALISALFAVKQHYYALTDVMNLLKTDLLIPKDTSITEFDNALSVTENWLLKTGVHGAGWFSHHEWTYYQSRNGDAGVQTDQETRATTQINKIKSYVSTLLPPLFTQLDAARNGREAAGVLYQFLTDAGVERQLQDWVDTQNFRGNLELANQSQQVWQTFCDILDEYVTILGEVPFNADDFQNLLAAGFASATYSQIPSTLDQVVVSEIGIVQTLRRKVVFVIGATDQVMPEASSAQSLLTDADQEILEPKLTDDQFLASSSVEQLAKEPFVNYLALVAGRETLVVSAPLSDENGTEYQLSPYVQAIVRHFDLSVQEYATAPQLTDTAIAPFVGTVQATLSNLVQVMRSAADANQPLPGRWAFIYRSLKQRDDDQALTTKALAGLEYQNIPTPLRPEIVDSLYGKTIHTSVSKLEEFYQNQMAYFLKFGLQLQEREMYELSAANSGEFFHASLDAIIKRARLEHRDLHDYTAAELTTMIEAVVQQVGEAPQYQILASSARMQYLGRQLKETILRMGRTLQLQSRYTPMKPTRTEVLFGQVLDEQGISGLNFTLPGGKQVKVRGKIDRIDQLTTPAGDYVGVVDYKSSSRKLNLSDAYQGLAMQMLTYMNVLQRGETELGLEGSELSGALYMHIQNPKLKLADTLTGLEAAQLKQGKYEGVLLNDPEMLDELDQQLVDQTGFSNIFPFRKTKKGFTGNNLLTGEQLELLIQRNLKLIQQAATDIFSGSIRLNPARWGANQTALQYSEFKDIFQFDAMLPENNYHQIETIDKEDLFKRLKGADANGD